MVKVVANAPIRYAGRAYRAGDVFEARRKDARLLSLIHRVDIFVEPVPVAAPAPAATGARRPRQSRAAAAPVEAAPAAPVDAAPAAPVEAAPAAPVDVAPAADDFSDLVDAIDERPQQNEG